MNTFNFKITFVCVNTGKVKTTDKSYKALNFTSALNGINDYAKTNKTFKKVISISDKRGS